MSKWQLPSQKGTELWPSATRSPVKLVFEGVPPGSPLAELLFQQLKGEINQFYVKSAQSYALSTATQQGNTQRLGDTVLQYKNNQGSETVRVHPAKSLVSQAMEFIRQNFWDYALIDLLVEPLDLVPVLTLPEMVAAAVMRVPGRVVDATTPIPSLGVAAYPTVDGEADRIINMARPGWVDHVTDSGDYTTRLASWTLDMSGFGQIPIVTADIYASLLKVSGPGPLTVTRVQFPVNIAAPPTSYFGPTPQTAQPADFSPPIVGPTFSATAFADRLILYSESQRSWVFDFNNSRHAPFRYYGTVYYGHVEISPGVTNFVNLAYLYDTSRPASDPPYVISDLVRPGDDKGYPGLVSAYGAYDLWVQEEISPRLAPFSNYDDGPDPVDARLQATTFPNRRTDFTVGQYGSNDYRWDYPQWPERAGHTELDGAEVGVVLENDLPDGSLLAPVLDVLKFVGTVTIDRRNGGVSFKPA